MLANGPFKSKLPAANFTLGSGGLGLCGSGHLGRLPELLRNRGPILFPHSGSADGTAGGARAGLGIRRGRHLPGRGHPHLVDGIVGELSPGPSEWDGIERIDMWLVSHLGADDNPFVRVVGRKFLISAIARAMRPGCKVDTMLVLEGEQGIGKSMTLQALGEPWVLEELSDMKSKDCKQDIQGHWLVEVSELDAMRKNEVETVKAFVAKQPIDLNQMPPPLFLDFFSFVSCHLIHSLGFYLQNDSKPQQTGFI